MLLSHHYDAMQQVHGMIAIFTVPCGENTAAICRLWADM